MIQHSHQEADNFGSVGIGYLLPLGVFLLISANTLGIFLNSMEDVQTDNNKLIENKVDSLFEGFKIISVRGDKNLNGLDDAPTTTGIQVLKIKASLNLYTVETNLSLLLITISCGLINTDLKFDSNYYDSDISDGFFGVNILRDLDNSFKNGFIMNSNDLVDFIVPVNIDSISILSDEQDRITIEFITSNNSVTKEVGYIISNYGSRFLEFC